MKQACRFQSAVVLGLALSGLVGCQGSPESLEESGQHAAQQWYSVKSSIALEMAESHFNGGQLVLAEKTVADATINDPENPQLWLMAGRIALENADLEVGYQRLAKAIDYGETTDGYRNADKAQPYYYQGIIDQRWQRFDVAKQRYTQAYQLDADNVAYFLARVEMMVQLGELQAAASELQAKAKYFEQNPTVRALLGHICRRQGKHEEAVTWFQQAAMLAPEDMKLLEEGARAHLTVKRYDEAAGILKNVIEAEYGRHRFDLHRLLAEAYLASGRTREARKVYAHLTTLDRTSVQDWSKLGEIAYQLGEYGVALQAANHMIKLTPDDHHGYLLAGMIWNQRSHVDKALRMFDRAAELAPHTTVPLIMRGIVLQKNNKPAAAADAYKQALKIDADDLRAKRLLASVSSAAP